MTDYTKNLEKLKLIWRNKRPEWDERQLEEFCNKCLFLGQMISDVYYIQTGLVEQ